jgi:hypothetical protein
MGILKQTVTGQALTEDMSFRNFLSGRLLWDEAMGSAAARWVRGHTREPHTLRTLRPTRSPPPRRLR